MTCEQAPEERLPTADERAGMAWWNGLPEHERAFWMAAAQTPSPAVAWAHFQQRQARRAGQLPS